MLNFLSGDDAGCCPQGDVAPCGGKLCKNGNAFASGNLNMIVVFQLFLKSFRSIIFERKEAFKNHSLTGFCALHAARRRLNGLNAFYHYEFLLGLKTAQEGLQWCRDK